MNALARLYFRLLSFPRLLLLAILVLAILLASYIPQLKIDASSDSLVLEGDQSLVVYRDVTKTFGSSDFLFLAYKPDGGIYSEQARGDVAELSAALEAIDGVESVVSYLNVPLLYSPKVSLANISDGVNFLADENIDITLARAEFATSPIYKSLLTSSDESTLAIQVNILPANHLRKLRELVALQKNEIEELDVNQRQQLEKNLIALEEAKQTRYALEKQLVAEARQALEPYKQHGQVFIGGVPMIISDMLDFVRADMMVFGSVILVFIILVLSLIFQQLRWVLLPLLTCLSTCVIMLGGIAFVGMKLTVISANFVALLLIITLSVTIHLAVRFIEYEQENPSFSMQVLVQKTMGFMFKPCVYTTLTTMVAFLSLIVSGIRPVIDFGWMMTIALALALTLAFLILPAGLSLTRPKKYKDVPQRFSRLTYMLASFTEKNRGAVMGISVFVFVFSVAGVAMLKVENRFIDYFDESTDIFQGMLVIDQQLGGTLPLEIILNKPKSESPVSGAVVEDVTEEIVDDFDDDFFGDDVASFEVDGNAAINYWFSKSGLDDISKVHHFLDDLPSTGKVVSLATLYQIVQDITDGTVDDIQLAIIKDKSSGVIADTLISPYLSKDGEQVRLSVRVKETSEGLHRSEMLGSIEDFLQNEMQYAKDDYQITGMMVMYNNMLQSLYASQITTLAAVFVAIMLMFGVLFRSVSLALLAITPNVLAALFVLGAMGWFGIPLDIMTITIAAITIGIGVDDTIHYVHRFSKEIQKDGDYVAAMYRCHKSIGRAMFYTSFTIIAGFSILGLSNFTPSIYFGLLTGLAMFAALIGALVVLPLMIVTFKPFKLN